LADNHDIISIRTGTAPVPTQEQRDLAAKSKEDAAKEIGSLKLAEAMKNMPHMDPVKILTNHKERFGGRAAQEPGVGVPAEEEGSSAGAIVMYIVIALIVVGALVYFLVLKPDTNRWGGGRPAPPPPHRTHTSSSSSASSSSSSSSSASSSSSSSS
jgi:hypothetical protein